MTAWQMNDDNVLYLITQYNHKQIWLNFVIQGAPDPLSMIMVKFS